MLSRRSTLIPLQLKELFFPTNLPLERGGDLSVQRLWHDPLKREINVQLIIVAWYSFVI